MTIENRFEIVSDDIVRDRTTGLMWTRARSVTKLAVNWNAAQQHAAALGLGGFSDWRLPTRAELLTLVDDTRHGPAIDTDVFTCESEWYWTSTPAASSPSHYAWIVDFGGGNAYRHGQSDVGFVRAVCLS